MLPKLWGKVQAPLPRTLTRSILPAALPMQASMAAGGCSKINSNRVHLLLFTVLMVIMTSTPIDGRSQRQRLLHSPPSTGPQSVTQIVQDPQLCMPVHDSRRIRAQLRSDLGRILGEVVHSLFETHHCSNLLHSPLTIPKMNGAFHRTYGSDRQSISRWLLSSLLNLGEILLLRVAAVILCRYRQFLLWTHLATAFATTPPLYWNAFARHRMTPNSHILCAARGRAKQRRLVRPRGLLPRCHRTTRETKTYPLPPPYGADRTMYVAQLSRQKHQDHPAPGTPLSPQRQTLPRPRFQQHHLISLRAVLGAAALHNHRSLL